MVVAQRCHRGDAGLQAPASCCTKTQAHREGLILPGAHRRAASASWTSAAPSPSGGAVASPHRCAWQGAPLSHPSLVSPGALVPAVPCSTGVCRPPRLLLRSCGWGSGPNPCAVTRRSVGFPALGVTHVGPVHPWSSSRAPALGLPASHQQPAEPWTPSEPMARCCCRGPGAVAGVPGLQQGSRGCSIPVPARGCSLGGLHCPCPACALNSHHASPP